MNENLKPFITRILRNKIKNKKKMLTNCNSSGFIVIDSNNTIKIDETLSDKLENCLGIATNTLNFLLNLVNIIVFANEEFQKPIVHFRSDIFTYYLFKSLLDFIQSILNLTVYISFLVSRYDHFKVVNFQIYYFLFGTSTFCSSATEIITTLVLFLSTGNHQLNKLAQKIKFNRIIAAIFFLSIFVNWYRIPFGTYFNKCMSAMSDAVSLTFPSWIRTLSVTSSFIRDALFPIILMVLNLFLLFQYKMNLRKKKRMICDVRAVSSIKLVTNLALAKVSKSKIEITKMTMAVGLKSVLCHIPLFLTRFNFSNTNSFYSSKSYYIVSLFLFDFSFCTDFFIYFFFNKKFKAILLSYFQTNNSNNNKNMEY